MKSEKGKNDISILIISEYPLDSILTETERMDEAKEGIYKYIKEKRPDVVILDGIFSDISAVEWLRDDVVESRPTSNFMERNFDIASEFMKRLYEEYTPPHGVHIVLSDNDERNVEILAREMGYRSVEEEREKIKSYESKVKELKEVLLDLKEGGVSKERIRRITSRIGAYKSAISKLKKKKKHKMPKKGSPEYRKLYEETMKRYVEKIEEKTKAKVSKGSLEIEVNGYRVIYTHKMNILSVAPSSSSFNKVLERVNMDFIEGEEPKDFIIESGHNGETVVHPLKHRRENDRYSLVVSAGVLQDPEVLEAAKDGKLNMSRKKARISNDVKRAMKHSVFSGIVEVGKKDGEYYFRPISLNYLAKLGKGDVSADFKGREIIVFSDLHFGKGTTRYEVLRGAINEVVEGIDEKIRKGEPVPLFVNLNESLQGYNYKTFPVEYSKRAFSEFKEMLEAKKREILERYKNDPKRLVEEIENFMEDEYLRTNEPRLDNQIDLYYYFTHELLLKLLKESDLDPAYIVTESTHLKKTTGEFGLTETFIQTYPYKLIEEAVKFFEKEGDIEVRNERVRNLYGKIKRCESGLEGWENFDMRLGEAMYRLSVVHKDTSAGPTSNLARKSVKRSESMRDYADINLSGHHHSSYVSAIGRRDGSLAIFCKSPTFAGEDSYGASNKWPAATIGYMKVLVPEKEREKGIYEVRFSLSDKLSGKK